MTIAWDETLTKETRDGAFVRQQSVFRDRVSADGSTAFRAEPGRYHLYICLACPWAHRALIVRHLKGLESVVSASFVDPFRDERGWRFDVEDAAFADPLHGWTYLSEAYAATDPGFEGRVSVPVLWDTHTGRIVNNESADVIVMLNEAWDEWGKRDVDLYPGELRQEVDQVNQRVYEGLNNGVYRAGFARSQQAYEAAYRDVFATLDWLEDRLTGRRYLVGGRLTLADWRAFTTLLRFDPVYHNHFRCNRNKIAERPVLQNYLRDLYQVPGVAETVDMDQIKRHYYTTHPQINPTRLIPAGPALDLTAPHGRERLG